LIHNFYSLHHLFLLINNNIFLIFRLFLAQKEKKT
jgi:hypothetical protein